MIIKIKVLKEKVNSCSHESKCFSYLIVPLIDDIGLQKSRLCLRFVHVGFESGQFYPIIQFVRHQSSLPGWMLISTFLEQPTMMN